MSSQWARDKMHDLATKHGLRLTHGYEAVARVNGIGATIGDGVIIGFPSPLDLIDPLNIRSALNKAIHPTDPAGKGQQVAPITDPLLKYVYSQADQVHGLMSSRLPEPGATFSMYQSYFETSAWSDAKWKEHNEGSGIKFANQHGATKGANGYAYFEGSMGRAHWADAFAHELKKGANPAGAATLEDYVARLKKNRYFESSEALYLSGLKRARLVLSAMPAAEWNYNANTDYNPNTGISTDKKESIEAWWDGLPWYEKGAALGISLLLAKQIFS